MSGMELLLRAAERTVAWGRDPIHGGGDASPAAAPVPSRTPPASPRRPSPPKKRAKLGGGRRDSGLSPEQWQNILQTVMATTAASGEARAAASGKANRANKANAGESKANKSKSGRGRRRKTAPLVRDVDGNDIGMGYFSAIPARNPPPRTIVSPVASPVAIPVPRPVEIENKGEDDAAVAARRRLCRAYLAALHRPGDADQ